ncbi:cytochrome c [Limnohabitans sp.]|uniref:c-type cytochrome n=1 Tax=Limnohabitans sp. TaxID=1907725 RepID=UPI0026327151|nr:cytochrome c [Limnohabitans sp.]
MKISDSLCWSFVWLLAVGTSAAQAAGNPKAGQAIASQCAACHGVKGLATLPSAPNLAGQSLQYLDEQLKLYRSGKRQNETMVLMAKPLTDQQIEDLAAWYNSIPIQIAP